MDLRWASHLHLGDFNIKHWAVRSWDNWRWLQSVIQLTSSRGNTTHRFQRSSSIAKMLEDFGILLSTGLVHVSLPPYCRILKDLAYVKVVTITTHWVPYQSQHCWLRQLWTEQQTFKVLYPQMRKHHKVKDRNRKGDGYLQPCRPFRRAPWAPSELLPTGRDIHTGRHICTGRGANFGILLRCRILGDPLGRCIAPLASRHWRYLNSLGWLPGGFLCFSFFCLASLAPLPI